MHTSISEPCCLEALAVSHDHEAWIQGLLLSWAFLSLALLLLSGSDLFLPPVEGVRCGHRVRNRQDGAGS